MAVKGSDFFQSIEGLSLQNEIDCRNVISRSYYAAYNSIIEKVGDVPSYSGIGCHESLCLYLKDGNEFKPDNKRTIQRIGFFLTNMKTCRHRADYELSDDISSEEARILKEQTREFLELIIKTDFDKKSKTVSPNINENPAKNEHSRLKSHLKVIK